MRVEMDKSQKPNMSLLSAAKNVGLVLLSSVVPLMTLRAADLEDRQKETQAKELVVNQDEAVLAKFSSTGTEWRIHQTRHGVVEAKPLSLGGAGHAPATTVSLTFKQTNGQWADEELKPAASIFWGEKTVVYGATWKSDRFGRLSGGGLEFGLDEIADVNRLLAMYAHVPPSGVTNITCFFRAPDQPFEMDRTKREIRWLTPSAPIIREPKALLKLLDSLPLLAKQRAEYLAAEQQVQQQTTRKAQEQLAALQAFLASEAGQTFCRETEALRNKIAVKESAEKKYLDVLRQAMLEESLGFGNKRNATKAEATYLNATQAHKDSPDLAALKKELDTSLGDFQSRYGVRFDERQTALAATLKPEE